MNMSYKMQYHTYKINIKNVTAIKNLLIYFILLILRSWNKKVRQIIILDKTFVFKR
jgi:hypothetical protein